MDAKSSQPFLFASFSSADLDVVDQFIGQLAALGITVWSPHRDLQPGEAWSDAIANSLSRASGVITFLSASSLRSLWAQRELSAVVKSQTRVFPITVGDVDPQQLSQHIGNHTVLPIASSASDDEVRAVCQQIAQALSDDPEWQSGATLFDSQTSVDVASTLSADLEQTQEQPSAQSQTENTVFVVHGHDHEFLDDVLTYLSSVGIEPIVLTRIGSDDQSLFQRFFRYGQKASFAIALINADDMGASRVQYEADGVGDRALQFRARQNVILELGFFFGRLGWQNVFVLQKEPDKPFPNFERPSDLEGVVFNIVDGTDRWKSQLTSRLKKANLHVQT